MSNQGLDPDDAPGIAPASPWRTPAPISAQGRKLSAEAASRNGHTARRPTAQRNEASAGWSCDMAPPASAAVNRNDGAIPSAFAPQSTKTKGPNESPGATAPIMPTCAPAANT